MAASCWRSLASRAAVPVPSPTQDLWSVLWKDISAMRRRLRRLAIAFQSTLMIPIPRNSPSPFRIRTNFCHVHSSASAPSWNAACTMARTFIQLVESGKLSHVAEIGHWKGCFFAFLKGCLSGSGEAWVLPRWYLYQKLFSYLSKNRPKSTTEIWNESLVQDTNIAK